MESLYIFGAKYLWVISVLIFIWFLLRRKDAWRLSAIALPLSYLSGLLARALYENPRPFVVENFTPLIEHAPDNGFPSDHVLLVATIASIATIFNKKIGLILWVITLLVAISRVAVGVHHALDVFASVLISIIVALVVYSINKKYEPRSTQESAE